MVLHPICMTRRANTRCGKITLHNIEYADMRVPVSLELFVDYGRAFQKKLVPSLRDVRVTQIHRAAEGFDLELANGEHLRAKKIVIATGTHDVEYMPEVLQKLPATLRSHSAEVADVSRFRDRQIAVIGAGASATTLRR